MKLTAIYLSVLGLTLLAGGVGAWAQGGTTTVTPVSTYKGTVMDEGKMKDAVSPITDQATFSALWTDWGITKPQPTVDFTTQLVVVSTTRVIVFHQALTLDDAGNLTVAVIPAKMQPTIVIRGFSYVIAVISNAGITSVNGVALPTAPTVPAATAVPILRSAAFNRSISTTQSVLTVTDEKTWEGLWGTTKAPVTMDFTKEEALLVSMQQTNANYIVAITGVTETAQRITATATANLTEIQPSTITPSMVAIIPKSDKPVYFTETVNGGAPWTVVPVISTISNADSLQKTADTAVIKDVAAWKDLYDKRMPAGTKVPDVNFGDDMVLAVFAGKSTAVTPIIGQVIESNGQLSVSYHNDQSSFDDTPLPTSPWTAVVVPKSDLPVTFTDANVPVPLPGNEVTILRQSSGKQSPFTAQQFTTITTDAAWKALWGDATAPVTVDFTKEEALLCAMGREPLGNSITITEVRETDPCLTAYVTEGSPHGKQLVIAETEPYSVVVIPKSDKPVQFDDVTPG